jgi:hypothetical protein
MPGFSDGSASFPTSGAEEKHERANGQTDETKAKKLKKRTGYFRLRKRALFSFLSIFFVPKPMAILDASER